MPEEETRAVISKATSSAEHASLETRFKHKSLAPTNPPAPPGRTAEQEALLKAHTAAQLDTPENDPETP